MSERRRYGLSLRAKVLGSYLGVLLIFGTVLGFALFQMAETRSNLSSVASGYMAMSRETERLSSLPLGYLLGREQPDWERYRPNLDQLYLDRMDRHLDAIAEHGGAVQGHLGSPVEFAALREVLGQAEAVAKMLDRYRRAQASLESCLRRADPACLAEVAVDLADQRAQISDQLAMLRTKLETRIQSALETAGATQMQASRRLLWLSTTAIVLAGLMFLLVHLSLRPIERLQRGAQRVAEGRYEERVEVGTGDEIGKLADEFNRMAEALGEREKRLVQMERLATVGRMSAQVAHEIRNPLNALSLNAEMLEDEVAGLPDASRDEAMELLGQLRAEIDRLAQVTETYLSLARTPTPELEEGDLGELLRRVLDFVADELTQARITATLELEHGLPPVPMDEGQLRQALLNLLRNGVEAQPDGGTIRVAAAGVEGGVEFSVEDRGEGVPADLRDSIFDPFMTTRERGTGLGLAITRQIVEAHDGSIRCESAPGGGALFRIRLPLEP
jgi:two-component system, NtrC family, sensor kinase